jgi:hypothetical protein
MSLSAAMDGGFTAICRREPALAEVGASDQYRLIGGVTVMLHIQRLGLDLPLRATGDADFGVPLPVLLASPVERHPKGPGEIRKQATWPCRRSDDLPRSRVAARDPVTDDAEREELRPQLRAEAAPATATVLLRGGPDTAR